jgi:predicted RNA-binding protein YlxR (DUF448 family)
MPLAVSASRQPLPPRRFPRRTCVACRTERDKRDLVRVVRTTDGDLRLDASGRVNGRGAYLCADASCWALAVKKSALQRALGVPLTAELRRQLEEGDPTSIPGGPDGTK